MRLVMTIAGAALLAAGCAGPQQPPVTRLKVTMTGIQEVPGPGDPDGTGTAEIRVNAGDGQVCWDLYARQIDPATAAHIHRGGAGIAGPPVVTLTTPDAAGRSQGCASVEPEVARAMAFQGFNFYVNVHTASHPAGAIRGQLRGGAVMQERRVRRPTGGQ
jgi:hypothetical protein